MLQRLHISNYAIIDELEIDFSNKLNIITGETGAGKSIIAGALGLILGVRSDSGVLLNKEKKCIVEGLFLPGKKENVKKFLEENDLDPGEELLIRREIAANGKSRAFINDTPVNLNQVGKLTGFMIDLHQQFGGLELGESGFQLEVIDALAAHSAKLTEYRRLFQMWERTKKEWEELLEKKRQFDKEADYNQFQFNELEKAGLKEMELEDLEKEASLLAHAGEIKETLSKAYFELKESESPITQQLKILVNQLSPYSSYHPTLPGLLSRLQSIEIELKDISDEIGTINHQVQSDPSRMQQINERLSEGYKLQKKHGVHTTAELLDIQKQLELKLQEVFTIGEEIKEKENRTKELLHQALSLAATISDSRKKQIKDFEVSVNKLLVRIGMPNARLRVEIRSDTELNANGFDTIEFLFDGNKNNLFLPLRKVASGGELSRLMLCIKSLVAQSIDLPTLVFDEIDTGISGEAARQAGIIMKELAACRQIISITHQPQIAGKADAHFFVYKIAEKNTVKTNIRLLSREESITTIAKMLSGEKPTAAALENARELAN